jgi:hypothetical protein
VPASAVRAVLIVQTSVRRLCYLCNARGELVFKKQQSKGPDVIVADAAPSNCRK